MTVFSIGLIILYVHLFILKNMCFLMFNDHDVLNNWNYIYVKKVLKKNEFIW